MFTKDDLFSIGYLLLIIFQPEFLVLNSILFNCLNMYIHIAKERTIS